VRVYKYSPGHENCNRESSKKDKAWQVPLAIDLCSGPLTYAKLRQPERVKYDNLLRDYLDIFCCFLSPR
jgi:hypothetical protein